MIDEIHDIVADWNRRNVRILRYELAKQRIGDTQELARTLKDETFKKGNDVVTELSMLVRGRFRDMGVGKGTKLGRTATLSRRQPKKWYSKTFYGRLNDLQGVLGFEMMEQTMNTMRKLGK